LTGSLFQLVGGIGLFLLGMTLLTDGLKSFAGDKLRQRLESFSGKPIRAFLSGAVVTALVQSSSATIVAVIGFVSAGLLSFPVAVGMVIGASLGTTATGWIVSLVGLKISMGLYSLPLVGIGVFVRLLASVRWRSAGTALAGFGLIFLGIDTLQAAMEGLSALFGDLSILPSTGFFHRLIIVVIGICMTVVMQSSSAAMATTLTALHTNSIEFDQAALLVIGAAIGTTVTGALAAIGANVPAKRTALAHVLFNLATGLIALILLPAFLWLIEEYQQRFGLEPGASSLAMFHTTFVLVGVLLVLPFVRRFSGTIERILPEPQPTLTRHLDASVLNVPAVALEATRRALTQVAVKMFDILREGLARHDGLPDRVDEQEIRQSLLLTQQFFAKIPPLDEEAPLSRSRLAQMHAIDHLVRLQGRLKPPRALLKVTAHPLLKSEIDYCREILDIAHDGMEGLLETDWLQGIEQSSLALADRRRQDRSRVLSQTSSGEWEPSFALEVLDTMRWVDRIGYHTWRICHYLGSEEPIEPEPDDDPTASEV